jgi:cell division transport system permease protein
MQFFKHILKQTLRNLQQTMGTQLMTLLTVALSVLIFSFFFLIYTNMMKSAERLGDDLRIVIYLQEEIVPQMLEQMKQKIRDFNEVDKIVYVDRKMAFERLKSQLGENADILADLGSEFLPPSIEVYPKKDLGNLIVLNRFAEYLGTLPGALKVQYGHEWLSRFSDFIKLLQIIVILSGILLILTTTFIVSYTIRLTVVAREAEIEVLRLLGASSNYIRGPLLLEGVIQGFAGSMAGIATLGILYNWVAEKFSGPGFFNLFDFTFFAPQATAAILLSGILLCTGGSLLSIRKFLRI